MGHEAKGSGRQGGPRVPGRRRQARTSGRGKGHADCKCNESPQGLRLAAEPRNRPRHPGAERHQGPLAPHERLPGRPPVWPRLFGNHLGQARPVSSTDADAPSRGSRGAPLGEAPCCELLPTSASGLAADGGTARAHTVRGRKRFPARTPRRARLLGRGSLSARPTATCGLALGSGHFCFMRDMDPGLALAQSPPRPCPWHPSHPQALSVMETSLLTVAVNRRPRLPRNHRHVVWTR